MNYCLISDAWGHNFNHSIVSNNTSKPIVEHLTPETNILCDKILEHIQNCHICKKRLYQNNTLTISNFINTNINKNKDFIIFVLCIIFIIIFLNIITNILK